MQVKMQRTLSQNSRNADTPLTKLTKHFASRFCRYNNSLLSIITIIINVAAREINHCSAGFSLSVSIIDNITFLLRVARFDTMMRGKGKR